MNSGFDGKQNLEMIEREAHALIERRRYAQAQATVSRGLSEFPDSIELLYLGAFIDYASDRQAQAMQDVKNLLARAPEHFGGGKLHALLLEQAEQFAEAERVWIELLRRRPQDADCFAGYGKLMLKTLHLEKAQRLAQEGLRQSPEHADCLYLAAMIDLIRNRGGTRSEHLQRMLREHPEQARSAIALAVALSDAGNDRGALRVAQELLRQQPDSPHLLKFVRALKARTHWSMLPLYPILRWGWTAAIAITLLGIIGLRLAQQALPPSVVTILSGLWLGYVVYSWIWPRLLRRIL